jgi:hypothetical protein
MNAMFSGASFYNQLLCWDTSAATTSEMFLDAGGAYISSSIPTCTEGQSPLPVDNDCICTACQSGRYSATSDRAACKSCPRGYIYSVLASGLTECTACGAGHYAGITGSRACIGCEVGRYTDAIGSDDSLDCIACPVGYIQTRVGGTNCSQCALGQYEGSGSCFDCAPGRHADESGLSECKACPSGMYTPSTKALNCSGIPCAKGKYGTPGSTMMAGAVCIDCVAGTYADITATASADGCIACPAGQSVGVGGSDDALDCARCQPGKYAAEGGASICDICPDRQYVVQAGAKACLNCSRLNCTIGEYNICGAPTDHASEGGICIPCLPGKFLDNTARLGQWSTCKNCAPGKFSPAASTKCTDCP